MCMRCLLSPKNKDFGFNMEKNAVLEKIKYVIWGVVILAFQACVADRLRIFGIAPNIVLCYVMCVSFRNHDSFGFYNALVLGLAADALGGRIFGEYTFFFVLFDLLISKVFYKLFSENFWFEFFGGVVLNIFFSVFFALTAWLFEGNFLFLILKIAFVEILYNSAVFLVFLFLSKKRKQKRRITFRID